MDDVDGGDELEQKLVRWIVYILAGIVGLGALLDARSNAVALSNTEAAVVGTVLLCAWAAAETWLRRRRLAWRTSTGTKVAVTSLGAYPRLALVGALVLLASSRLMPRVVSTDSGPADSGPRAADAAPPAQGRTPPSPQLPGPSRPPIAPERAKKQEMLPLTDLMAEARLSCSLNESADLPPGEVDFMPVGPGADAKLTGSAGDERLRFVSPVRFREHAGTITVINRFALAPGAELRGRPVATLLGYDKLVVPIVTVVYGGACVRMRLLEVSIRVNGDDVWYGQWRYDVPFQQGPVFTVPLTGFHERLPGHNELRDGG